MMSTCVRSRKDALVIIASVAIIVISIICAAIVSTKSRLIHMTTQEETHSTKKLFDWCLPYDVRANRSTPEILEKLNKTLIRSVQHWCAYNKEQATLLLELMSNTSVKEFPKTFDAGNFALSRASAHQHLIESQFYGNKDLRLFGENVNLDFDVAEQDPLIDHARNITVMKSAMVVQLPGLYYIYSRIFFKPDSSQPCKNLPTQIWEHHIILSTDEGAKDKIIFKTTYTCCDTCVQHKKTSYIGGLFDLKKNDRLRVEVSSVGVASFRKEGSYFGLFMLE